MTFSKHAREAVADIVHEHGWELPGKSSYDVADMILRAAGWEPDYLRCDMGVGCDEVGVCYAEAHGQPKRCPSYPGKPPPTPA